MQAVVWLLPVLERPEHQGAIQLLNVDAAVGQPALTAPLPAGRQTTGHGQPGFPAIETDGLAQRQPSHHRGEQHQMTLVAGRAVLTQETDQLSMDAGRSCRGTWIGFAAPRSHGYPPTQ